MISIINCGGSGSRLWPLSTPDIPKQLLSISEGGPSMVQMTYGRVKDISSEVFLVTEASHAHRIKDQLPEVPAENIIIEPARRGTASCFILTLHHIKKRVDSSEPILFLHSDQFIRDIRLAQKTLLRAAEVSASEKAVTLIGIEPNKPSTSMGYIHKEPQTDDSSNFFKVAAFKEKPDLPTAKKYLASGEYLWNMGTFAAPLSVFENIMQEHSPDLHKDYVSLADSADLDEAYLLLQDWAIDYALHEKATDLLVVPGSFDWLDLGSFEDFHSVSDIDEDRNTLQGLSFIEDSRDTMVVNKTQVPVGVIGIDNATVVATEEGILVVNKSHSQKVGPLSKRIRKEMQ